MQTRVMKAFGDPGRDRQVMEEAGRIIRAGGLVAIPTETVYGLAGDALRPESSKKIYEAKGRPSDNPLIVHIARLEDLDRIARDIPGEAYALAGRYWPGPLTMVLNKKEIVPRETTGGLDTVAVRFPVNKIAQEFILASGGFIAAPSANISGRPSCTRAEHCLADLEGRIELIIDGGEVGIGLESTIVDLTGDVPCILRQGYINEAMLKEALGNISRDTSTDGHPKAPGMKYRHYAPKGRLTIVKGDSERVAARIKELLQEHEGRGERAAVISAHEHADMYRGRYGDQNLESNRDQDADRYRDQYPDTGKDQKSDQNGDRNRDRYRVYDLGSLQDEDVIAHRLFAVLRELDDEGMEYIYSESFDTPRLGEAIMDRLMRAAGHNVIQA